MAMRSLNYFYDIFIIFKFSIASNYYLPPLVQIIQSCLHIFGDNSESNTNRRECGFGGGEWYTDRDDGGVTALEAT